jgi:hypothetical protein
MLRCISNQKETPNGQEKIQQRVKGIKCFGCNKRPKDESRVSILIWGSCESDKYLEEATA